MTTFRNSRTIEQFKNECGTSKIFFRTAFVGKGADKKPLTYNDAEGKSTDVQKVCMVDDANNTIGWCALAVARDILAGKNPANNPTGLAVIDAVNEETGAVYENTLVYPASNNRIEGLTM